LKKSEYSVYLGYGWEITEDLRLMALWKPAYQDYHNGGRSEWLHILGAGLEYRLSPHASLQGMGYFTSNHSNVDRFDYDAWQLGLGLNLSVNF
jgi:hypothetical protein